MQDLATTTEWSAVRDFLLAFADDEFFAGHHLSTWLAVSPTLEEDNALTSIAQDELGHARLWYDILAETEADSTDELALRRRAADRRNTVLVETEHEDFADTITRHYLYDEYERLVLEALADGSIERLADNATVALNEEPFHLEHAQNWLDILGATEESRTRLERGFTENLQAAADLFRFSEPEDLVAVGALGRSPTALAEEWETTVTQTVSQLPIDVAGTHVTAAITDPPDLNGRQGEHTDALATVIERMQPAELERI